MKKRLMQMTAILCSALMLAGCTSKLSSGKEVNPSSELPLTSTEIKPGIGGTENLTAGKGNAEITLSAPEEKDTKALSDASVKLLSQIADSEGDNANTLISPASIMFALGMTENGADGETLKQMEDVVNGGTDYEKMNEILAFLSDKLRNSEDVNWNVANSVWFKNDGTWQMKDGFLNNVVNYYRSEVYKAAFDQQTVTDINNWVNDETYGMIPEIIKTLTPDARMVLVNAIAFEGEWMQKYEDSDIEENRTFVNADGSESQVTMLYSEESRYFTLAGGEGFVKPYEGGEYSFVGILPKEGENATEYMKQIAASGDDFSEAVRNARHEDVRVRIPEFSLDYGTELNDAYKEMGMELPFSPAEADFTKMMEPVSDEPFQIWISQIIHKTHIEVDRKGTKAAAATAVMLEATCSAEMPEQQIYRIYLDRPFVYAIVDNETGLPVFLGCQNSME